jgi:integrase
MLRSGKRCGSHCAGAPPFAIATPTKGDIPSRALLTDGHNPWYVAQQLGHVDVQMVYRVYGKFIREDYQRPKAPGLKLVAPK